MDFKLLLLGCMVVLAIEAAPAPADKPKGGLIMDFPPLDPGKPFSLCFKSFDECEEQRKKAEEAYEIKRLASLQKWVDNLEKKDWGKRDWRKNFGPTAKQYDELKKKHGKKE